MSSFLSHMASHKVVLAAIYSASVVLSATYFCFLLHQEVIPDPMLKQYPVVLFRSIELPAQSASMIPRRMMSSPWVYFNPYLTISQIYQTTCLAATQYALFGSTMN